MNGQGEAAAEGRAGEVAPTDRALMERVKGGDEAALGALMARWEIPIKTVVARIVLNAAEAEELAQETLVRVWQQREKYREGAEFRPWIFSIAINLARNRLRWWRRRPTVELNEWSESEDGGSFGGVQGGRGTENALERKERATAVRAAIAALPVDLREAIVLFEYEQMSHAEIAATVGATPKAVETRIHRARERLRMALTRWA